MSVQPLQQIIWATGISYGCFDHSYVLGTHQTFSQWVIYVKFEEEKHIIYPKKVLTLPESTVI